MMDQLMTARHENQETVAPLDVSGVWDVLDLVGVLLRYCRDYEEAYYNAMDRFANVAVWHRIRKWTKDRFSAKGTAGILEGEDLEAIRRVFSNDASDLEAI